MEFVGVLWNSLIAEISIRDSVNKGTAKNEYVCLELPMPLYHKYGMILREKHHFFSTSVLSPVTAYKQNSSMCPSD